MRITFFEAESWERPAFQRLEDQHHVDYVGESLTDRNAAQFAETEVASTFIYSTFDRKALEQLPNLRLIATRSTGFDHIDLEYCQQQNIAVAIVPSYGENTVAEHVFALLLTISRRLVDAVDRTRRGDFSSAGLCGFALQGKTPGVIGTGDIGRCVIRIARGFGMTVLGNDTQPDSRLSEDLEFRYVPLDELLAESDIVFSHVPGNDHTENLLSSAEFDALKPGAVLINTSRGSVVDVHAMLQALADGQLAAAGLDVLPE